MKHGRPAPLILVVLLTPAIAGCLSDPPPEPRPIFILWAKTDITGPAGPNDECLPAATNATYNMESKQAWIDAGLTRDWILIIHERSTTGDPHTLDCTRSHLWSHTGSPATFTWEHHDYTHRMHLALQVDRIRLGEQGLPVGESHEGAFAFHTNNTTYQARLHYQLQQWNTTQIHAFTGTDAASHGTGTDAAWMGRK